MHEIDPTATDSCCLDESHTWRRLIISSLERIDTCCFTIGEGHIFIRELTIFEIVSSGLELIELTVLLRCHRSIESIAHDDEVIRETVLHLGRYIGNLDDSLLRCGETTG